jgi:hypothetical protein
MTPQARNDRKPLRRGAFIGVNAVEMRLVSFYLPEASGA